MAQSYPKGRLRRPRYPSPARRPRLVAHWVKYQILILFLVASGTALGALCAVLGASARLTDARHRLRLDRLS